MGFMLLLLVAALVINSYAGPTSQGNELAIHKKQAYEFFHQEDYSKAIEEFNKALSLDPTNASLYNDRSVAYFHRGEKNSNKGDFDKAIIDAQKAIKLDNKNGTFHMNLGNAYVLTHKYDAAIREYNKALDLTPNYLGIYPSIMLNKAKVYEMAGKKREAIQTYKEFLSELSRGKLIGKDQGDQYRKIYERMAKDAEESIKKLQQ